MKAEVGMSHPVVEPVQLHVPIDSSQQRKALFAAVIGNALETYDFALYGALTPVIARLFFPALDTTASLLSAFSVFAVGFLGRPIGAVIFGHIGDKVGRQKALVASILLMAIPTGLIGLLPTYAQIGILAPILLTVLRLLQGISFGGEFAGTMAFLVEHAPPSRRGFIGSLSLCSNAAGILLGSAGAALVAFTLSQAMLEAWGWRVPFLVGTLIGLLGLYMRAGTLETPHFAALEQSGSISATPVRESLRHARKELFTVIGLTWLPAVMTFMIFVYITTYLTVVINLPLASSLAITSLGLVVVTILQPVMGRLSDRVGRKPLLIAGAAGTLLLAYPLFFLLSRGDFALSVIAMGVFSILLTLVGGPLPATVVELVPTRTRYSILSMGYGVSQAVFAGTSPIIATFLIQQARSPIAPSFYLILSAVATLATSVLIKETYRDQLK
jgi:MFS transporter, MHS family, proline/betaine transporter